MSGTSFVAAGRQLETAARLIHVKGDSAGGGTMEARA
jgi:hypothetical protein